MITVRYDPFFFFKLRMWWKRLFMSKQQRQELRECQRRIDELLARVKTSMLDCGKPSVFSAAEKLEGK